MSRNYDNWERLVAAVLKRDQIRQLCHRHSISSDFTLPISVGSFGMRMTDAFEFLRPLRERSFRATYLVRLVQDVKVSDRHYFATGTKAVVKSLNTGNITEDEFELHMIVLGNCSHENVAIPWLYRFSETRKLVVYDYYSKGSVFDMLQLQGNKGRPNWESRMRIAVGAARGIAHIHTQCEGKLAHGNIKSSNIFLNPQQYGCVSDFGLAGIPEMPPTWWDDLEYYSSELDFKSPSQKSDVYSFGLLLLEIVTGKTDVQVTYIANQLRLCGPDALNLNGFLPSIFYVDELDIMEDMALEKFPFVDSDLNTSSTLQQMLQVAKKCLADLPKHRPTMSQVVLELESIPEISHITALSHQSYQHSGVKKRVWHRFFPFGR